MRRLAWLSLLAISCAAPRAQVSPVSMGPSKIRGTYVSATTGPATSGLTDTQLRASPVPVSGTVTANIAANSSVNLAQVAGVATATGNGTNTGAVRVAIASDNTAFSVNATPVGTTAVSGTVTANQGGTWTVQPGNTANTTAWKVDGSAVTQPVSGTVTANAGTGTLAVSAASLPLPTGAATSSNQTTLGSHTTKLNDGTNTAAVKPASTAAAATDPALVVAVSPNNTVAVTQATAANLNAAVVGTKTNNNAAPGATNVGDLPAIANAASPAWTEGNQTAASADLSGATRVVERPFAYGTLGHYKTSQVVSLTASQAANGSLFSFRWGDATRFAVITSIRLTLIQTAAATATILPAYQVFIARSFSASDSIGTAVTLTGNNMKKRTSMGTTLVTDMRFSTVAAGLTVGTRTLDASPLLTLQTVSTITAANSVVYVADLDVYSMGYHPIVLATNEGIVVRGPTVAFGLAGTANLIVEIGWAEVAGF
jgi:hypothetical protein